MPRTTPMQEQNRKGGASPDNVLHRRVLGHVPAILLEGTVREITFVGGRTKAWLGCTPAQWMANPHGALGFWREHVVAQDRAAAVRARLKAARTGQPVSSEYRMLRADGSTLWVQDSMAVTGRSSKAPGRIVSLLTDISRRKQVERELEETRTLYHALLDHSPLPILFQKEGICQSINAAGARLLGFQSPADIVGKPIRDMIHPASLKTVDQRLARLAKGRGNPPVEMGVLARDGTVRVIESASIPVTVSGKPAVMVVGYDLTERKLYEERFSKAFHSNPLPMAISSAVSGLFIDVNESFVRTMGYPRAEIVGRSSRDLNLFVDYERRQQIVRDLMAHGRVSSAEVDIRTRDGRVLDGLFSADIMTVGSEPVMLTVMHDITARKQAERALRESEARFRLITENSPDALFLQDRNLTYQWVHNFVCPLKSQDLIGKNEYAFLPRLHARRLRTVKRRVMRTGRAMRESLVLKVGGQPRYFETVLRPWRDDKGRIIGVAGYGRDVTERQGAEDRIRELNEDLERRVEERTREIRRLTVELSSAEQRERRRLAHVVHDHLQQILVGAKFRAAAVEHGTRDAETRQAMTEIAAFLAESIQAARELTRDLSPPALYEAGLACALESLGREAADRYKLDVCVDSSVNPSADAEGMGVLVCEAVRELLLNIAKHARAKSARVRLVRLRKGYLRITIIDDGVGFDETRLPQGSSAGFGLHSIRERVELLGGRLSLVSTKGGGTRVTLTVPWRGSEV